MKSFVPAIFVFFLFLGRQPVQAQSFYALDFVENKGQWKGDFRFKTVAGNGTLFISNQGYTVLKNNPEDFSAVMEYIHGHEAEKTAPAITDSNYEQEYEENAENYGVMPENFSAVNQGGELAPTGEFANGGEWSATA